MLHPATRRFFVESLRSTRSLLATLHGYVYLRWPFWYIGCLCGKRQAANHRSILPPALIAVLKKWFSNSYHGKVMPPGTATRLIQVDKAIDRPLPESVLPYSDARRILLEEHAAVALLDCPCRLSRSTHCEPVDVCILVGDTVVDFALAHHPNHARKVTPAEAIEVIRRCNEQGLVTHAFFKTAVLNRFYAICNCCTCCCGAMQGHFHGVPMLAASGQIPEIVTGRCVGCGTCARRCPFRAISMQQRQPVINISACMGCGVCTLACPTAALVLRQQGPLQPLVL